MTDIPIKALSPQQIRDLLARVDKLYLEILCTMSRDREGIPLTVDDMLVCRMLAAGVIAKSPIK